MFPVHEQRVESPPSGPKVRQIWTPAEDQLLARAVQLETPKTGSISWCSVAAHLPGRNNKDCRKRWHYSIAHGHTIRKGTWTREEDQRLRDAVVVHGTRWSKIAQVVGTRNGDQCWKRWYDCLDPQIDKSPWTPEEDDKLLRMVTKHGRNWTGIVNKHFPKRTSLSAKNRYSILQRKQEPRSSPQAASPSRSSSQTYSHTRNMSSGSGASTTTTTTNNVLYDMIPAITEPDHLPTQQNPQIIHSYWSPTPATSSPNIPSGPSTPESSQTDLVDWSTWGGMNGANTPDLSSSVPTSYEVDSTTSSYLSPSSTVLSMHSPLPDYDSMLDATGGFYQNSFMGAPVTSSMVSTTSYSPVVYSTDSNGQFLVPSYKTW